MSIGRSASVMSKEESALRLYEKNGLETDLIAERFGVTREAVNIWLRNAKHRRQTQAEG